MRLFFQRLRQGLARTHRGLTDRIRETVGLAPRLDDALLDDLETVLIAADCGADLAAQMIAEVRAACARDQVDRPEEVIRYLRESVAGVLRRAQAPTERLCERPRITVFVGVNGSGKTTAIGKIGAHYARAGRKVLFAAADTFRAAADEQLEIWGQRAGALVIRSAPGADPAAVAFDAVRAAVARGIDDLLIDTAGRLQSKTNLMAELAKVKRSVDKARGGDAPPASVLLVIDATTGQNGFSQAAEFTRAVGVDGIVLTKIDGTAKGGIVLAIAHRLRIPVLWIGVGESIDDLETFDPDEFAAALFD